MTALALVAAVVAALVHVLIFGLESLWFHHPRVYRRFQVRSAAELAASRAFAFNQGFYNLFLALGAVTGVVLIYGSSATTETAGRVLLTFACASMTCAGLVLLVTNRQMVRAALVQLVPPATALLGLALSA
jgi:putative membrane protein